jgi:hypothetical protein
VISGDVWLMTYDQRLTTYDSSIIRRLTYHLSLITLYPSVLVHVIAFGYNGLTYAVGVDI